MIQPITTSGYSLYLCGINGENVRPVGNGLLQPAFSPDGKKIAACRVNYSGNILYTKFFTIDCTTLREEKLFNDSLPYPISNLSWSPDGKNISFSFDSAGNHFCKVMAVNDPVGERNTIAGSIRTWSPDGKRFVLFDNTHSMFIGTVGSTAVEKFGISFWPGSPLWMKDGNTIAYLHSYGIDLIHHYVAEKKDSVIAQKMFGNRTYIANDAAISPDGKKVLYIYDTMGTPDSAPYSDLMYYDCDRDSVITIVSDVPTNSRALWSADSRRIVFATYLDHFKLYMYQLP